MSFSCVFVIDTSSWLCRFSLSDSRIASFCSKILIPPFFSIAATWRVFIVVCRSIKNIYRYLCLEEGRYQYGDWLCYASDIIGYDRSTAELYNTPLRMKQDTTSIEI